jgi:hypothetical protein
MWRTDVCEVPIDAQVSCCHVPLVAAVHEQTQVTYIWWIGVSPCLQKDHKKEHMLALQAETSKTLRVLKGPTTGQFEHAEGGCSSGHNLTLDTSTYESTCPAGWLPSRL